MGTSCLVIDLIIPCVSLLLPFFLVVILVKLLATPYFQHFARNQSAWPPDSPLLSRNLVPLDRQISNIGPTVSQYTREHGQVECVFCLCDVDEGDEIRELACKHLFHRSCLDRWLEFGRATCPLCRDSLLPFEAKGKLADMEDDEGELSMALMAVFTQNTLRGGDVS